MSGELAVHRRLRWIKGIDKLKVRRVVVESLAVDHQVAVVSNAHAFIAHCDHALDVKVTADLRMVDGLGFKDNDLAPFRPTKVIGEPVHEQMVAADDFE